MAKDWPAPASEDEAVERLVDAFTGGEYVTQEGPNRMRAIVPPRGYHAAVGRKVGLGFR